MPIIWLFSDERSENSVLTLAAHLPVGSGILLRHDRLPRGERWRLARRLMRIARARRLMVMLADRPNVARAWGVDGVHLRHVMAAQARQAKALGLPLSMPVHSAAEANAAHRAGVDAAFISPVHATRSHQGAAGLGIARSLRLARGVRRAQAVALGGMDAARARDFRRRAGPDIGWAAIDAHDQEHRRKRKRKS